MHTTSHNAISLPQSCHAKFTQFHLHYNMIKYDIDQVMSVSDAKVSSKDTIFCTLVVVVPARSFLHYTGLQSGYLVEKVRTKTAVKRMKIG